MRIITYEQRRGLSLGTKKTKRTSYELGTFNIYDNHMFCYVFTYAAFLGYHWRLVVGLCGYLGTNGFYGVLLIKCRFITERANRCPFSDKVGRLYL